MLPLSIAIVCYVIFGMVFALVAVLADRKKARSDSTSSLSEPALFWLYMLVWPIAALLRFASPAKKEKKR